MADAIELAESEAVIDFHEMQPEYLQGTTKNEYLTQPSYTKEVDEILTIFYDNPNVCIKINWWQETTIRQQGQLLGFKYTIKEQSDSLSFRQVRTFFHPEGTPRNIPQFAAIDFIFTKKNKPNGQIGKLSVTIFGNGKFYNDNELSHRFPYGYGYSQDGEIVWSRHPF